jgi:hypothetical protein
LKNGMVRLRRGLDTISRHTEFMEYASALNLLPARRALFRAPRGAYEQAEAPPDAARADG